MARSRSASRSSRRAGGASSASRRDRHVASSRRPSRSRSRRREVPETKGEIALSIDETNELRRSLGLKPLSTGPSTTEQKVVNVQKSTAQVEAEREQAQLKQKLAQSKTRRALSQKVAGKSLGEQLKDEIKEKTKEKETENVLEWVKQSREMKKKKEEEKKEKEKEYTASALAGMTVAHSIDAFEDGQELVLTLKDTNVLENDGNDLNHAPDELVNVELHEKDRHQARQTKAQRAAMPVYSAFDDDEFLALGTAPKRRKTKLLAQYDEEQDAADAQAARTFQLDTLGGATVVETKPEEQEDDQVAVISLAFDRTKKLAEYYTQSEMDAKFSNKKSKKKRKKSVRRKVEKLDGEAAVGAWIDQLEHEAMQQDPLTLNDRGKRQRKDVDDEEEEEEEEMRRRFEEAREQANARTLDAVAANVRPSVRKKRRIVDDREILDDAAAVEQELGAALARAKAARQTRADVEDTPISSEARITQLVQETIGNNDVAVRTSVCADKGTMDDASCTDNGTMDDATCTDKKSSVGHVFGDVRTNSHTVVFNEATDFETRLRDAMEKRAAQFQAASGESRVVREPKQGETRDMAEEKVEENEEKEKENEEKEEGWGEEQPLVGTGVGATLALLRKTGDLRQTRNERQAGRANDVRDRSFEDDLRIKNGVKLDYRDEFGRLLTKKEAFRMLSYKFHGHEPGKKKKEKRLKQLKEELEAQKQLSGEGSTKMMKVLERKQKHTKEAHVVLSSGV